MASARNAAGSIATLQGVEFVGFSDLARQAVAEAVLHAGRSAADSILPEHLVAGLRGVALPGQARERVIPDYDGDATFRLAFAPSTVAILEEAATCERVDLPALVAAVHRQTGHDLGPLAEAAATRERSTSPGD